MVKIETLAVGMGQANCYIIHNQIEALIIDPGADEKKIKQTIENLGVTPVAILLTHAHYDHIGAVDAIRDEYEIPVYLSSNEKDWLQNPRKNLSAFVGHETTARAADHHFKENKEMTISDFTFKVVLTPGHSPGGVSFVFEDDAFVITGDALFAGSIGRTDFPGSSHEQLLDGVRTQLFSLPDHYTIYPGHMGQSTIGHEKTTNPFF